MWTSASSQTDLPVYSYLLSCPCVSTAFLCSHTKSDPLITFTSLLFDCDISCLFSFILAWSLLYLCISFLCFHADILQRECFLDLARTLRLLCTTSQCCQEWGERDSLASKKKGIVPGLKNVGHFQTLFIGSRSMLSIFVCGSLSVLYTFVINICCSWTF